MLILSVDLVIEPVGHNTVVLLHPLDIVLHGLDRLVHGPGVGG